MLLRIDCHVTIATAESPCFAVRRAPAAYSLANVIAAQAHGIRRPRSRAKQQV